MHKKFKKTNNEYNLFSLKLQQKKVNFYEIITKSYKIITKSGQFLQNYYEIRPNFTKSTLILRNYEKLGQILRNYDEIKTKLEIFTKFWMNLRDEQ